MTARPIIQLLPWVAGLFAGLSMLASCGFAQCRKPKPMVTGTFITLTLTTIANGGGAPPPHLAAPFEAIEPLSLEVQDDKAATQRSFRVSWTAALRSYTFGITMERGADAQIRDGAHRGTPLLWAEHVGSKTAAGILRAHQASLNDAPS